MIDKVKLDPWSDGQSVVIGGLTFESDPLSVALYGQTTITRSKEGLAKARDLRAAISTLTATLEAAGDLPETAPHRDPVPVRNPFR